MDRVFSAVQRPYSDIPHVAVAIGKTPTPGQYHVGILHRESNSSNVLLLDLAWHCLLRNVSAGPDYFWVDLPIPARRAQNIAARCRQIWKRNGSSTIPYGFSHPGDCFDNATGQYLFGATRVGLTCASFVLAVFHFAGVPLIRYETWPTERAGDREWQEHLLSLLQGSATSDHISAIRSEIGAVRYRPLDVAGSATQTPPVEFEVASQFAEQVLLMIERTT